MPTVPMPRRWACSWEGRRSGLSAKQPGVSCLPATSLAAFRLLNVRYRYTFVGGPCQERRCRRMPHRHFTDRPLSDVAASPSVRLERSCRHRPGRCRPDRRGDRAGGGRSTTGGCTKSAPERINRRAHPTRPHIEFPATPRPDRVGLDRRLYHQADKPRARRSDNRGRHRGDAARSPHQRPPHRPSHPHRHRRWSNRGRSIRGDCRLALGEEGRQRDHLDPHAHADRHRGAELAGEGTHAGARSRLPPQQRGSVVGPMGHDRREQRPDVGRAARAGSSGRRRGSTSQDHVRPDTAHHRRQCNRRASCRYQDRSRQCRGSDSVGRHRRHGGRLADPRR